MNKLLPCPFCGNTDFELHISCREDCHENFPKDWFQYSGNVVCKKCLIRGPRGKGIGTTMNAGIVATKKARAAAWNKRAEITNPQPTADKPPNTSQE